MEQAQRWQGTEEAVGRMGGVTPDAGGCCNWSGRRAPVILPSSEVLSDVHIQKFSAYGQWGLLSVVSP